MLGIVTPVKNEEKNLLRTFDMLVKQTYLPKVWVIVDDNSTDNTPNIIRNLEREYDFIIGLSMYTKGSYDEVSRYGLVVYKGFKFILDTYKNVEFIGILDADILLKNNYYEVLMNTFSKYSKLGVASGRYLIMKNNHVYTANMKIIPAAMIFRKECLLSINGFPISPMPDIIALLKAVNRGWLIGVSRLTYAIHLRERTSFHSYLKRGIGWYRVGYHPLNALLSGFYLSLKNLSLEPMGLTIGYIKGVLHYSRIIEEEVKKYYYESFYRRIYSIFRKTFKSMGTNIGFIEYSIIEL